MNKGQRYYITEAGFENLQNAGILRIHNQAFLRKLGFKEISLHTSGIFFNRIKSWMVMFSWLIKLKQQDIVLFHFPIHSSKNKILLKLILKKSIPAAVIIVDIDGLRDQDKALLKQELALLNQFNRIIAHNNAMKKFLEEKLPSKNIFSIGIFDYNSTAQRLKIQPPNAVCFAGNIEKSPFIYELKDVDINIYGLGFDITKANENLHYKGAFDASTLPAIMEGNYGLVWDGKDVLQCDPYLQYNNPHKLSLYLSAGLPVIVWSNSAVAPLVLEKNIGITVNNLIDLKNTLDSVTPAAYHLMQQNAAAIGVQLNEGFFLQQALLQITKEK